MADVYLAMDTILDREVAVKVLRGELSNDPVTLLRFQREANAASKLNHPNVVEVYDVGEADGKHYIVMENVRGRTLKQLIQLRGAMHVEEAVNIMKQIVAAVEHAHENNIIHRDIKPQNILIKDDGSVKITDFGIALAHDAVQLTQTDSVLGSAHYLAPETTRGESATNQIDIYALGIVFYELLKGDVPFHGENPVSIAMKHLSEEIPSIREFNPSLPQSVENIIMKATVKNRALRYKTAQEMLDDLNVCLDERHAHDEKIKFDIDEPNDGKTMVLSHVSNAKEKEEVEEVKEKTDHKTLMIGVGVLTLTLLIVVIIGFTSFLKKPQALIPNVSNMSVEDAQIRLESYGFQVGEIIWEVSDEFDRNLVINTYPEVNSQYESNGEVDLIVSKGNYFIIDDYTGKPFEEVKAELEANGIEVTGEIQASSEAEEGMIISQDLLKKGDKVEPDSTSKIHLVYAKTPKFMIPNVGGHDLESAKTEIEKLGGVVIANAIYYEDLESDQQMFFAPGKVIQTRPEAGSEYIQEQGAVIIIDYYAYE